MKINSTATALSGGIAVIAALTYGKPAQALVNIYITDVPGAVQVDVEGSLAQPRVSPVGGNCPAGFLSGETSGFGAALCTGPADTNMDAYPITGPNGFGGSEFTFPATSVSGLSFGLLTASYSPPNFLFLSKAYAFGTPINSSATFAGKTLASLGFTSFGLAGSWFLPWSSEPINVYIGRPVPGPLPLIGTGAAFAFSRRLRRRVAAHKATRP